MQSGFRGESNLFSSLESGLPSPSQSSPFRFRASSCTIYLAPQLLPSQATKRQLPALSRLTQNSSSPLTPGVVAKATRKATRKATSAQSPMLFTMPTAVFIMSLPSPRPPRSRNPLQLLLSPKHQYPALVQPGKQR